MLYSYECPLCHDQFEVVKHHSQYLTPEKCIKCDVVADKTVTLFAAPTMVREEYSPAFGTVVKSKRHREQLAKEKGMIEVGNESPETLKKEADKTLKQKLSWDNVL